MKPLLNITPSMMETYRKHHDQVWNGFMTREKVIDSIQGKREYKKQLGVGSAMHDIIEFGYDRPVQEWNEFHYEGHTVMLSAAQIEICLEYRRKFVDQWVRECRFARYIDVDRYKVRLSGRADGIRGLVLHEDKTTGRHVSRDDYEQSMQWKLYLFMLPDAHCVQYNIFQYNEDEPDDVRQHTFTFWRSKHIAAEIYKYLYHLIAFAESNNVVDSLTPAWAKR